MGRKEKKKHDSEVAEIEIKTEIEVEEWKPPDVSGTSNQNPPLHTFKGPMIKLEVNDDNLVENDEVKQQIKKEPVDEEFIEQNVTHLKRHIKEVRQKIRNQKCDECDKLKKENAEL